MKLEIKSGPMGNLTGMIDGVVFDQEGIQLDRAVLLERMLAAVGIEVVHHFRFWDHTENEYRQFSDSNINGRVAA